jgi:hypothetical protein
LHPSQNLFETKSVNITLLMKEKSCLMRRRTKESSDDSLESDESFDSRDSDHYKKPRRSSLAKSKVKASIPLYQKTATPQENGPTTQVAQRVGGFFAKCKELWDKCCYKHFPPIQRDPEASIPMVETKRGSSDYRTSIKNPDSQRKPKR